MYNIYYFKLDFKRKLIYRYEKKNIDIYKTWINLRYSRT